MLGALILTTAGARLFTAFHASLASANRLFDYHITQMALALQDSHSSNCRLQDRDTSHGFDFVIQIWSDSGSKGLPVAPAPGLAATGGHRLFQASRCSTANGAFTACARSTGDPGGAADGRGASVRSISRCARCADLGQGRCYCCWRRGGW